MIAQFQKSNPAGYEQINHYMTRTKQTTTRTTFTEQPRCTKYFRIWREKKNKKIYAHNPVQSYLTIDILWLLCGNRIVALGIHSLTKMEQYLAGW